jgi:hypothetical protein
MSELRSASPADRLSAIDNEPRPADPDAPRWRREHFIPLRKADLVRYLADDAHLKGDERKLFLELCVLLSATFHYQYHQRLEALKDLYAPFNPDSVTKEPEPRSPDELDALVPRFFGNCRELLEAANYHRLTREEIAEAAGAASDWGVRLKVDFEAFEQLEVFARGDVVGSQTRRDLWTFYRPVEVTVPLYQRLVVLFRLREHPAAARGLDTDAIYLKIFKTIPKKALDLLLPCSQFRMTLLDRGKIILPTVSGLVIAGVKLATKGAALLAFAGFYGLLAFLGLVVGTLGYGVKSFLGYQRTKDKYQLNLTRNLYYQNLDNNAGVLFRLLDEAEEQEFREAVLAYALLRRRAGSEGWTPEQLDQGAEQYLGELLHVPVDFEVHDALEKLTRLGVAEEAADGRWRAVPLSTALARLDRAWDDCFHHQVADAAQQVDQAGPSRRGEPGREIG